MKLVVNPGARLAGETGPGSGHALPGDKSLSHRAALFAALAEGESAIDNFLVSGVTDAMLNALTDLNVAWELKGNRLSRAEGLIRQGKWEELERMFEQGADQYRRLALRPVGGGEL